MDTDMKFEDLELNENAIVPVAWDWSDNKSVTAVKN